MSSHLLGADATQETRVNARCTARVVIDCFGFGPGNRRSPVSRLRFQYLRRMLTSYSDSIS